MRYATTTTESTELHRQDRGKTSTHCGMEAPYDTDADAATFGLMVGTLTACPDCEPADPRPADRDHGHPAQKADGADMRPAIPSDTPAGPISASLGTTAEPITELSAPWAAVVCRRRRRLNYREA
ncbi:hypothetical protein AB8O64_19830 [Streptomyces sp. QH1-20]|uniref:hypothetical protein n=1 Tax=Streptomyces sp. QH1-20 TaxID=3240934 RepID=UPI003518D8A6